MKHLPTVFLSFAGVAVAADAAPWLSSAESARADEINRIRTVCAEVDQVMADLGVTRTAVPEPADTSMPEIAEGETVAVSDGGMVFDALNSRVTYLDNVRVNDAAARLRCSERLYIQFPKSEKEKKTSEPAAEAPIAAVEEQAAPAEPEKTAALAEPTPLAGRSEAKPAELPVCIEARDAVVDTVLNCVLLRGSEKPGEALRLSRGDDYAVLTPAADGSAPQVYAAPNGDIMISCGSLELKWKDSRARECRLKAEARMIYFRSEDNTLVIDGRAEICTPDGELRFDEGAEISFAGTVEKTRGFMGQFTGKRLGDIAFAEARGNVAATAPAAENRAAASAYGDVLRYRAETGECEVLGRTCRLVYGSNELRADDSLKLHANGDITLSGSEINGIYERESARKGEPLRGTLHSAGKLVFCAADGTVFAPNGIDLRDEQCDFSCSGAMVLRLTSRPEKKETPAYGNLNLAVARYSGISQAHATGGVSLRYIETPGQEGLTLLADDAELNLATGEALLTSAAGKEALLSYNGYSMKAVSPDAVSTVQLLADGDICVNGSLIESVLPGEKAATEITTHRLLRLERASGKLSMGENTCLKSSEGVLTTKGAVSAELAAGAPEKARPVLPDYPHLVYNFSGLKNAATEQGGTVRTPQVSMQCEGAISVLMDSNPAADNSMAGIRYATAERKVALAGKDSQGRIIRATGDRLVLDAATGQKRLTGNSVTLADAYNLHTAYGPSAAVTLDRNNNARITGSRQVSTATRISDQIEKQKQK